MKWFFNSHMSRKHKTNRQTNTYTHTWTDEWVHACLWAPCAYACVLARSRAAYGRYSIWLPKCHWYARNVCSHLGIMIFLNEFCTHRKKHIHSTAPHLRTHDMSIDKAFRNGRFSAYQRVYISSSQMVHFLTRTSMTTMTPIWLGTATKNLNHLILHVPKWARAKVWGEEVNVQRIFIKCEIKVAYTTSRILYWIRYALALYETNAPFLLRIFDVICCSTATTNIRPHDVMSLLSETSTNLRPLNWTERPNDDDDDDDDDIIHQTVSHAIKNILLYTNITYVSMIPEGYFPYYV